MDPPTWGVNGEIIGRPVSLWEWVGVAFWQAVRIA